MWKVDKAIVHEIKISSEQSEGMKVTLAANGFDDLKREYSYTGMFDVPVIDDIEREFDADCVVLEFKSNAN